MTLRHQWRKRLWPTVISTLLFALFITLGVWQMRRAEFKSILLEAIETREKLPAVELTDDVIGQFVTDLALAEYRLIKLRGYFRPEHTLYLDNKILDGKPGVHVLMPLRAVSDSLDRSTHMLINRGWSAIAPDRRSLPQVKTPDGLVDLVVRVKLPAARVFSLGELPAPGGWPQLWTHLEMAELQERLGFALLPWEAQLISGGGADGLVQRWARGDDGWVSRHRGYALQWFLMALVLLIMYLVLMRKFDRE